MTSFKLIAQNPKARHDFQLLDTFEAGIQLDGGEVKSVKAGHISIKEAYVSIQKNEAWLVGAYVKPYEQAGANPENADRRRKLLLHKNEIAKLVGGSRETSQTIVPLKVGLVRGYVKVEIALAKGKRQHDKRATIKEREQKREAARAIRDSNR